MKGNIKFIYIKLDLYNVKVNVIFLDLKGVNVCNFISFYSDLNYPSTKAVLQRFRRNINKIVT